MRPTTRILLITCALGLGGLGRDAGVWAHDFWIEPESFTPKAGATLPVRLRVGEKLHGDSVPRNPQRIESFDAVVPSGRIPIEGAEGADPAGGVKLESPGLAVLVYRSRASFLEMTGPDFEKYLAEEGLDTILRSRAERGESAKPAREIYSRCAKSLVAVGGVATGAGIAVDRVLGLPLELIPERNPYELPLGRGLPVRLIYHDQPLAGALVVAVARDAPDAAVSARTDAAGRAQIVLTRPGVWLIKTVHMAEAADRKAADWESLWATLTFEVPAPEPP
jgi:uncharacterized protein DUF4198